jgi:hypothetical protein
VTLAVARDTDHGPGRSIDALRVISDLYCFYERDHFEENCEALRVEYPSYFELRAITYMKAVQSFCPFSTSC